MRERELNERILLGFFFNNSVVVVVCLFFIHLPSSFKKKNIPNFNFSIKMHNKSTILNSNTGLSFNLSSFFFEKLFEKQQAAKWAAAASTILLAIFFYHFSIRFCLCVRVWFFWIKPNKQNHIYLETKTKLNLKLN